MVTKYDDVLEALFSGDIGDYVPDGLAHSFPIIGKENGRIVDCFFIFSYSVEDEQFNSPIARIIIDSDTKELIHYRTADAEPFGSENLSDSYPLQFLRSSEERWEAYTAYQDTYVLVRRFAFTDELSPAEKNTLSDYMKALDALMAVHQKPFYRALSPAFFDWAARMLEA